MEQIAVFQEKVALSPIDLRSEITSFDEILPAIWAQSIIENDAFNPLPII
jgi:hypothetical protein